MIDNTDIGVFSALNLNFIAPSVKMAMGPFKFFSIASRHNVLSVENARRTLVVDGVMLAGSFCLLGHILQYTQLLQCSTPAVQVSFPGHFPAACTTSLSTQLPQSAWLSQCPEPAKQETSPMPGSCIKDGFS